MAVPPRISLVTLGVADVAAATSFYEALGWVRSPASVEGDVSFFRTAGAILALWGVDDLRADAGLSVEAPPQFRGVALAINCADRAEVDEAIATAIAAGGQLRKPATATEWGGYSGYVADPDGHLIEIAHNPGWPLGDDGLPILP
jgi:catechol 2,3-dioxygenase-like lactoylglutathione lyase family enzyme